MRKSTALSLALFVCVSTPTYAASDADCAIWLCLPMMFPSGCEEAKSAFKDRIKNLKSPLPDFLLCIDKDIPIPEGAPISVMEAKEGVSAKINDGTIQDGVPCRRIKDPNGDHNYYMDPRGCIGTLHWVKTYMDGNHYGKRFYYDP